MAHERNVGGLTCSEVLSHLSDYLDGEVEPATRLNIENHLRGCDVCERFGGHFSAAVATLRRNLGPAEELESEADARLWQSVNAALDE